MRRQFKTVMEMSQREVRGLHDASLMAIYRRLYELRQREIWLSPEQFSPRRLNKISNRIDWVEAELIERHTPVPDVTDIINRTPADG